MKLKLAMPWLVLLIALTSVVILLGLGRNPLTSERDLAITNTAKSALMTNTAIKASIYTPNGRYITFTSTAPSPTIDQKTLAKATDYAATNMQQHNFAASAYVKTISAATKRATVATASP